MITAIALYWFVWGTFIGANLRLSEPASLAEDLTSAIKISIWPVTILVAAIDEFAKYMAKIESDWME